MPLPSWNRISASPWFRGVLIYSAFRAVYGALILLITLLLATSDDAPWWTSIIFLLISMVVSRIIFKRINTWFQDRSKNKGDVD
tara:strand:- start:2214 stop:2465 length:252 start_codon:yes stop_codon:yes gene_type:complete